MANRFGKGFENMDPVDVPGLSQQEPDRPVRAAGPVIRRANPSAWEKIVALQFPLVVEGFGEITHITCRRITGAQLTNLIMSLPEDATEAEMRAEAYGLIANVHPDVLDALEAGDLEQVMEAIRPFLPAALRDDLDKAALAAAAGLPGAD